MQIITQFYMAASNGWTKVVGVWNSAGAMERSSQAAQRYSVWEYARLRTRGSEEHLFADVALHITAARTRTLMSLVPLKITINLVCFMHVGGHRGMQYFFPIYLQAGWWLRMNEDYACTAQELYEAARGHVYVASTPFAPGLTYLGVVTIPPLAPFGDQSMIPLACGGGSAQSFFGDLGAYFSLVTDYGFGLTEALNLTGQVHRRACSRIVVGRMWHC
eukprot:715323-Amphidinium_carterae.1